MKLSIVIICWNDLNVIRDCLKTIFADRSVSFEVIVSDNGSTDGSQQFIRQHYPEVRIVENGQNLGFAKGNNVGIKASRGEWVLILNPDTLVHPQSLSHLLAFAEKHPEIGAVGCRVFNPDGSYQISARPFPTVWRAWVAALCLRPLARISDIFMSDIYFGWHGDAERTVDWQSGCCVMFRGSVLRSLGGFDEQFFYHYEEVDLCFRVWKSGYAIRFTPVATITHFGGQSVGRFRLRFEIEKYRNRYRYFYKHFGPSGAKRIRWASLAWLGIRWVGYGIIGLAKTSEAKSNRLGMYKTVARWNRGLDPVRFVELGEEPAIAFNGS